jgi:membrane protease YdiL (CAAX protease family)
MALKLFVLIPVIGILGIPEKSSLVIRHLITIPMMTAVYFLVAGVLCKRRVTEWETGGFCSEAVGGFIVGAGTMSTVLGLLALCGAFRITSVGSLAVLPGITVSIIMLALAEELMFRGLLYRNLEKTIGIPTALIISGLLFGVLHITNANVNILGIVSATLGGLLLCLCFSLTRRLWLPTFFHIGWNLVQPLFGVRVSGEDELIPVFLKSTLQGPRILTGGKFGPESSIVAIGIIGLLVIRGIFRIRSMNDS